MKNRNVLKRSGMEVIDAFRKDVFMSKTISEISRSLKKPYPKVHHTVREFADEGILKTRKVGKAVLCELELSAKTVAIFSMADTMEALSKKIPNIEKIMGFAEFSDDILVVTGSYARGKATKSSDVDLVVITREKAVEKQRLIESKTALMLPQVHPFAFTYKDFIAMLLSEEENYGKQIFRNRLIFRNPERYYGLIKEAIKNGFRG